MSGTAPGVQVPLTSSPHPHVVLIGLAALADDGHDLRPLLLGGDLALHREPRRPFLLIGLRPENGLPEGGLGEATFPWVGGGRAAVERIEEIVQQGAAAPVGERDSGPGVFAAGITAGWIGHELGATALAFYRTLLHVDGVTGVCTLLAGDHEDAVSAGLLIRRAEEIGRRLLESRGPALVGADEPGADAGAAFAGQVRVIQDHIAAGDVYQVNLSHEIGLTRHPAAAAGSLAHLAASFVRLHAGNPVPFPAFVPVGGTTVLALSPERYCARRGERIESRPIKGTRPRGRGADADRHLQEELCSSGKDRAENVMIVDLVRNDLSRVARLGTVSVTGLCELESFASVHHLVSTIQATLRPGVGLADILAAVHPAGSMTGAPKMQAVKILQALEGRARGPYAGGIGWFAGSRFFDLAMVIRSIVVRDDRAVLPVGAGIVADSDARGEYLETRDKARSLLAALAAPAPAATRGHGG